MRTTLTLDDAIDRELRELAGKHGASYKAELNRVLRAGLAALRRPAPAKPYRLKPRALGRVTGVDYDKVGQLADELDDLVKLKADRAAG
jgi:plasmid stability protein